MRWSYEHVDLGEPTLPDGTPIRRPVVTVLAVGSSRRLEAVVDSGSPLSVADAMLFARLGVDLEHDEPLFAVPSTIGRATGPMPVYEVELRLLPPASSSESPITWRLQLGARRNWHLPFTVLFGQCGWFDRFTTTIGANTTDVEI